MLKIYGTLRCPDCVDCCQALDDAGIAYTFLDFDFDLRYLKNFLKLRDHCPQFETVRENGSIGIPCILRENGSVTLDWKIFLWAKESPQLES